LISFGAEMGSKLIGEGVETATELATLQSLGVPYAQGYYLGRPAALPRI
jgi:EAL domain-containing protein (putative c-di-GMP-specific phosphodiesterase class I)